MKIISYNIQFGRGLDRKIDLQRICDEVDGADIICLQEVESGWQRSGDLDQSEVIAGILSEYYFVYGTSFDMDNSYKDSSGRVINRRCRHGDMILSKWPIVSSRTFNLPKKHYPSKFNMQMGFIEAVIKSDRDVFRIYNYHAGYQDSDERFRQIEYFGSVFKQSPVEQSAWCGKADIDGDNWSNQSNLPEMPTSAIVCGDFNASCETQEYDFLIDKCGLSDVWKQVDPININTSTLKTTQTEDIKVEGKIDHIFVTDDLISRVKKVDIDHHAEGSDHKPISCYLD